MGSGSSFLNFFRIFIVFSFPSGSFQRFPYVLPPSLLLLSVLLTTEKPPVLGAFAELELRGGVREGLRDGLREGLREGLRDGLRGGEGEGEGEGAGDGAGLGVLTGA